MASIVVRTRARIRVSIVSGPNVGSLPSAAVLVVESCIASSFGTRRQAGAQLVVELRRLMTRFLLFHQAQDTIQGCPDLMD